MRVVVVGEGGEGLLRELVRVLEVAKLEGEQGAVEARLEHVRREAVGRAEVGTGRVDVALTQLEHPEVAVGLRVVGIFRDRNLEGLRCAEVGACGGGRRLGRVVFVFILNQYKPI